jgi:RpiB/LacA/LacB family sugar-phosphate isomerase
MKKYNLLLPIAGEAQRFKDAGYTAPKPLIMANDRHIIDWAMESVKMDECNVIFVVRSEHIYTFSIDEVLRQKFGDDIKIVVVQQRTDGAVSTCLLAKEYINNDLPLIIYTPDVCFSPQFDPASIDTDLDGMLLTFKANSPAHSYLDIDENGLVTKTVEKEVISTDAAVGVYHYKKGSDFVKYAEMMIEQNIRTKNEFYICPMYNLLIEDGLKIGYHQTEKMHVLGTPEELEFFEKYVIQQFGKKPIGLCSDHSGFELKENLKEKLTEAGLEYIDFGTYVNKDCDYNEFVTQACQSIQKGVCDYVIGSCRSGNGVNICANKHKDIRAAVVYDTYTAEFAIRHNSANFFTMPSKYTNIDNLIDMFEVMKKSTFDGGRHMTRMNKTLKNG